MNDLYDVLEICLQEIENGADIETVLFRYPEMADELRPILEASATAKSIAVPEPASDVVHRNRSKVLQQAAQLREAKARPPRRLWSVPLRRALVSLAVIGTLFISSTNLVRAASTTLPGDNLYPVKRTWEDVIVLFTFDVQAREALEVAHENERLEELYELFTAGRAVEVDFSGLVTRQNGDLWLVAGIPVVVSPQTDFHDGSVSIGDAVRVRGVTQADGAVLAERVDTLPAGVPLPEVDDNDAAEIEQEHSGESTQAAEDNSGKGSESETPETQETDNSGSSSDSEKDEQSLKGVVLSVNGNILVVDGQILNISSAEIEGTPQVGATVEVEGYYDENGIFIVTKIKFETGDSGSDSSDTNGSDDTPNNNDDSGTDDSASGDDSSNDSDNSGSGGGGDD